MHSVKEKLSNVAAVAREKAAIIKAKAEEKAGKAAARTKEEKVIAKERRKAKEAEAKKKLYETKAEIAAEKLKHYHHHHDGDHDPLVGGQGHHDSVAPAAAANPTTGAPASTYPPVRSTSWT